MRRTKKGLSPSVDAIEPRVLLSTAAPLLSRHALSAVVRDVKAIMSTLARTGNTAQASAHLTRLSSRIPSGAEGLALTWQSDIALDRPRSTRSMIATERRVLDDLYDFVEGGNNGGSPPVTGASPAAPSAPGQGTGGTTTPVPMPSLDSVTIQNTTGFALVVTVHLRVPQVQQPWITETIPAQGSSSVSFDFGTATNAFMTMDVSRADGDQTPPPQNNISLSQPLSGYDGTLFTISLLGPYFNVTPL